MKYVADVIMTVRKQVIVYADNVAEAEEILAGNNWDEETDEVNLDTIIIDNIEEY